VTDDGARGGALSELLTRYSLLLSVGTSLDLRQNCRAFAKTLKARKKLAYVSVWVKRSLLTGSGDARGARLVYASPKYGYEDRQLTAHDVIIERMRATGTVSVTNNDPDFEALSDSTPLGRGALALVPLGNIGILKMFGAGRADPFSDKELAALADVLDKFTHSVADCLSYERVQISESKYRSLFEDAHDAVFISTPEGRVLDMNTAGLEMLGYSRSELQELHVGRDLFADRAGWDDYRAAIERQGHVKDYELVLRHKTGRRVVVLETSTRVKDDSGAVVAYRGIMRDVTDQRRLEQQLVQAQKMESLGLLAGGIAHDFNNLLTGILGYTSLLQTTVAGNSKPARYLSSVEQSARQAQELTSQLLGFARAGPHETRVVHARQVILQTLGILERTIGKSIQLTEELMPGLPTVEVDVAQIRQVIMNLCLNARDAMPEGGSLHLCTRRTERAEVPSGAGVATRRGPFVTVSVTDTGVGMSEETASRVFEPFYTTKEKGKGTGLGLALVYGVVKNHGGFVTVQSKVGKGTTFEVHLPISGKPADMMTPIGGLPAIKLRDADELVLVVDDDGMIQELARDILEAEGYRVEVASDGEEAVGTYQRLGSVDLVLLDMVMPKMDGPATYRALAEIDPNLRVVVSTGFTKEKLADEMNGAGVKCFLKKPYRAQALIASVREALDAR